MGRNPATDAAMVVFYDECDQEIHPLILYKLKSSVHIPPKKIEKGDRKGWFNWGYVWYRPTIVWIDIPVSVNIY